MTGRGHAMNILALTAVLAAVLWWSPSGLGAEQYPEGDPETGISNSSIALPQSVIQAKRSYRYINSDNRDPFESLILEKVEAEPGEEPKDPREMYDIEVIQVVAIVHTLDDGKGYASVLLPDGKYYTLVKGMKIGIHGGHVDNILSDRVIVKQEVLDFRRRVVEQTRELRLREEEDQ
jgi:Tfp pilus assembly protein PilP